MPTPTAWTTALKTHTAPEIAARRLDCVGDVIEVDSQGLGVLAAQCDQASNALNIVPAPMAGPARQATATAVAGAYTDFHAAAGVLAARATSTGYKLRTASGLYHTTDDESAQNLTREL